MASWQTYGPIDFQLARNLAALARAQEELLYEPTHPRFEEVLVCVLKKWTWINGGVDLPDALTLFYLHFEVEQTPVDDFQCLGDLMLGRPLHIMCFVRVPQRPDIRHRKSLEDAIGQQQRKCYGRF